MFYSTRSSHFHGRKFVGEFESYGDACRHTGCGHECACGGGTVSAFVGGSEVPRQIDPGKLPYEVAAGYREPTHSEVLKATHD